MERTELLSSKEYWLGKIQLQLFSVVEDYIKKHDINRTLFAKELGVSKGYISQVLNGDYDNRISKLVELSLSVGKVPFIEFRDIDSVISMDRLLPNGAVFTQTATNVGRLIPFTINEFKLSDYGMASANSDIDIIDIPYILIND